MRTYGSLARTPRGWVVTRAEPHVVMRMKRVFPKIATTATPPFQMFGADDLATDLLWFMERYPLQVSPEDRAEMEAGRARLFQDQAERIERLEEEKKTIAEDIKDVYAEAKGNGFDTKVLRKVIQLRKQDQNERAEQDAVMDLYMQALGMM